MEKTIKYLENGEYHYATVRSVGDLAQLKTNSKETLVEAINELWNGGGNADPSKAPKPEGYDQLVQDVADAVKNQQEISQQWIEWQKEDTQLTEERKQAYLQAMKEMQESIDKAKADAATLDDKTAKLDEQITKTFSDLDTNIQNMHEQLQKEADRMNQELQDTKGALSTLRTDLQNAQLDNGRIHDELTNINGKFEHKVWQTDLDPLKAQIDRAETSVQQTKDELLGKASREDLDTVTNAVSKLDTQLKETAKGVEISVKKDELGGDVARLLNDKTNLLLGTRSFSGEDNWRNRDKVTIEPGYYKGMKTAAVQVTDASIYQPYRVKANTAYTFSFFGKEDRDNPKATLVIKPIDAQNVNVDGGEQQVHITTEWQRFAVTFSVDQECEISIQIIQGPEATNNILHLAGLKLQYGQNDTPWEPNEADVAENIEHTESQFNVYSDQIAGIVKKQEKMGDTERQLDTRITETAEGLKQTSKDLQDANGKITEFKGQLESTARGLKTEYEKYTNDAVGQISDSTLNLIRNSSFQNKDSDFDQWQNISAKANVRSDENGLRWVELTQSGMTTDNPQGLTSNYFNVKQGKVTIAVDIKSGDKATLDNESVLFLELYNEAKKRVDFRFVTLSELGLGISLLGDHKVHRGLYRLGIDRNDAKYMTVKAHLMRNGDLYFTNFSARLSSIDDGAYEPNPDDLNQQILKQNTKIEQNSKEVAIKANSVDVTREIQGVKGELSDDIKSAKDAAIQVASGQINLRVNELSTQFDDKLNKRINEQKTASEKFTSDGIEQVVTKITNVKGDVDRLGDTVGNLEVGGRNLLIGTSEDELSGKSYNFADYQISGGLQPNKTYTLSGWARVDQDSLNHHQNVFVDAYSEDWSWSVTLNINSALTSQYNKITFTTPNGKQLHPYVTVYLSHPDGGTNGNNNDAISGKAYIKKLKLEEGNFATDYTHAPEDINKKIDTQVLDAANIDELKTQGHYFVKNLTGNPIGGWVYVDVTGNNNDRIRQDVYQDNGGKHMSRRLFGNSWSGWEQGAYISDVNNVKTEVTASVKNLGDRVITQVNSVETKVDNLSVGGRNYISPKNIKGYYAHEPQYNASTQEWTVVIDNGTGGAWGGGICFQGTGIVVPWGQAYTDSVEVYVTDSNLKWNVDTNNSSIAGASWNGNDNDNRSALTATPALNSVIPTSQWYRLSVTAWNTNPKNTNHVGINDFSGFGIINNTGHTVTVKFRRPKQELGSKVTDWSPNPDDTIEAIKEVNTKWDVANGQIQGKVTESQVNNILNGKGYATQSWAQTMFTMKSDSITLQAVRDNITNGIQNQVNSIDNRVTNITAGGTNLLKGTSMNPVAGDAPATDWKDMDSIYNTIAPLSEDQYVLSFEARGDIDNQRILTFLYHGGLGGNDIVKSSVTSQGRKYSNVDGGSEFYLTTQWARYWVIYNVSPENSRKQVIVGRRWANESSGKVYVRKVQLERGNVATDWRPAPEDQGSGVNVLRGTADFSWPTGIGINGTVNLSYERFDDTTITLHISGSQGGGIYTKWGDAFPDGQIQIGEQYTFSFDIKGSGTFNSVKNEGDSLNLANGVTISNSYERVKVVGTIKELNKAFIIYFNGAFDAWIKNVKIERGTVATPWTPHPFDDKDKGVNLLKSTAYWNPSDWNHISDNVWYDDNWTDNLGHKAYGHHTAWQGLGQTVYVTPGVYTWSAQIYLNGLDSNDSVYPYMGDGQYNGTAQVQDIRKPMLGVNDQNRWIDYSTTFYVTNAGNLCVRPELNRDHGTIHVGSQKLEHGMVATPWSPSPLDDKNATITLDSADINSMKTQGHYFVRNLANSPIAGWVYVDVTGNNNDRLKQEVYQDNGYEHRSRRWTGSGWTEWTTDVNNKNVISQINITPDQIKIASNKIVIDGNTDIHGVLRVPDVKLAGRNGNVDLSGDGINITKTNGAGINIASNGIQLTANTNGQNEIEGVITTAWSMNNKNQNGIGLVITPEQTLGRPYGGDILTIGEMVAPGTIHAGMVFDATGINPDYKRGFNWFAPHTLNGDGGVLRLPGAQDDLMLYPGNMPESRQSEYSQPTLRLVHGNSQGSAGVQFQWYDIVPFGRITSSMSYVSAVGTDDDGGITVSWYSYGAWYNGRKAPSIVYRGSDGNRGNGGIVFYPYGEVCFWQGDFHSNLRWSGMKNTD